MQMAVAEAFFKFSSLDKSGLHVIYTSPRIFKSMILIQKFTGASGVAFLIYMILII